MLLIFLAISLVFGQDCSVCSSDGSVCYDLSLLKSQGVLTQTNKTYDFSVSICQNIQNCGECTSAGYCQTKMQESFCVGTFASMSVMDSKDSATGGVVLLYSNGDMGRMGSVFVSCDPGGQIVSDLVAIPPKVTSIHHHGYITVIARLT
eukprot:TRINITY_DN97_c1_g1_i2.p1 TRINITY_DN97_c1_g1~~TRINITY_DN97_c1_g1_i2.p1  ORF type:complete len:149 (+),score=19.88 TRINITY_DN97_c1_g1_i2:135-581(+)